MSLLSRNQLRIGLCPDRLVVTGCRRGLSRRETRRDIVPTDGSAALSAQMLEAVMRDVEAKTGFTAGAICSRSERSTRGTPISLKPEGDPVAAWCRRGRCRECHRPGDTTAHRVGRSDDAMLSMPLAKQGKLYGVMLLQMPPQEQLEDDKVKALLAIGRQLGDALSLANRADAGDSRWHAAVEALPSALSACEADKPEVTVVLSNHFVRYALLPWNAELRSDEEWQSLARHHLAAVYGQMAESWTLQHCRTAPQGARVICAVDQLLIEALAEKVSACGGNLVSVQPYLMAAFNRVRGRIGKQSCWLVLEERGRLTLVLFEKGAWRAIRSRRVDDNWRAELPEILEREQAMLGLREPCTQAFVSSEAEIDSWSAESYQFVDLTLAAGTEADRPFAMALS